MLRKEKEYVLQLTSLMVQSVDLKLMWDELDHKDSVKQLTSETHHWQLLQESWTELSSVYLQSLVERMPRICEAVIVAKGGYFVESKVKKVVVFLF